MTRVHRCGRQVVGSLPGSRPVRLATFRRGVRRSPGHHRIPNPPATVFSAPALNVPGPGGTPCGRRLPWSGRYAEEARHPSPLEPRASRVRAPGMAAPGVTPRPGRGPTGRVFLTWRVFWRGCARLSRLSCLEGRVHRSGYSRRGCPDDLAVGELLPEQGDSRRTLWAGAATPAAGAVVTTGRAG